MTIRLIFTTTTSNRQTWWLTTAKGEERRETLERAVDRAYEMSGASEGELVIKRVVSKW